MKNKFNIGQKIKVITEDDYYGYIGTVLSTNFDETVYHIRLSDGITHTYDLRQLEAVPDSPLRTYHATLAECTIENDFNGQLIPEIKWLRARYNLGLKEAKDIVDRRRAQAKLAIFKSTIEAAANGALREYVNYLDVADELAKLRTKIALENAPKINYLE